MGTVICLACGYNRKTRKVEKAPEVVEEEPPPRPLTWKERYERGGLDSFWDWEIPIGLIAGSLLFIAVIHIFDEGILSLPRVLLSTAFLALVEAAWIYAGMCVMELFTSLEYGEWRPAMLKLYSIAAFWWALGVLFEWQAPGLGWTAHAAIAWPIEFFLIRWMFQLDSFQAMITMIVVVITQWIASSLMPG
jgi:hypothetical protein